MASFYLTARPCNLVQTDATARVLFGHQRRAGLLKQATMLSTTTFHCKLGSRPAPLRHPWRHCLGSGHATLALRADWQQQLATAHKELGFRHVRFHGLLDDDMGTLIRQDAQFVFSFHNIDRIFDFLLSIGMKPIVELGFMPSTLASGSDTVFHYRGNVTPPKNPSDWALLVTQLAEHWVERYGIKEVSQWPIEVWNEPNLSMFWKGDQAAYLALYEATWQALKAVSPRFHVGGPATAQNAWLPEFDAFCRAHHCAPDFLSTHYYPTDAFGEIGADTATQLQHAPPGVMRKRAAEARKIAGDRPLYYTEWNITSSPRDALHDGAFCAALAVKLTMSVDDLVDAWSWWVFSDIFEEDGMPSQPFHGGFGLMNLHGVPKPVFRGFELLQRLGTGRWQVEGSHDTVTCWAGDGEWQGKGRDGSAASPMPSAILWVNVAMPHHAIASESVRLSIPHQGDHRVKAAHATRIDETHANPRAAWQALGSPVCLSPAGVERLQVASQLVDEVHSVVADDAQTWVELVLPPQSLALVRLEWS